MRYSHEEISRLATIGLGLGGVSILTPAYEKTGWRVLLIPIVLCLLVALWGFVWILRNRS